MNFYKRHLGDIAKSCGDLSQGQMGAYDLLTDWHYANEEPLPLDMARVYRIGRATTKAERANVDAVLGFYFDKGPDGYTQKRALEEMAKAQAQAEVNRQIAEQREARKRAANRARTDNESCNEPLDESCTNRQPSHKPLAISQEATAVPGKRIDPEARSLETGTAAGHACRAMRDAGCPRTNPSHPDLLAALAEGVTADALADTVREGVETQRGNVFAWAIATARGRRRDGPKALAPASTGPPNGANPTSKTLSAIQTLEALKSDGLAQNRTADRPAEIALPQPGAAARA